MVLPELTKSIEETPEPVVVEDKDTKLDDDRDNFDDIDKLIMETNKEINDQKEETENNVKDLNNNSENPTEINNLKHNEDHVNSLIVSGNLYI